MEIVYTNKIDYNHFEKNDITAFYGDIIDLMKMGVDVDGIIYDDEWTVKRFLNGIHIRLNKRVDAVFKYLDIDKNILKVKIKDLSKASFKYVLLAYVLLTNKEIIILDHFEVGLSYKEQKRLIKVIRTLKKDGKTIVAISNNLVFLSQLTKSVIVIKDGAVIYSGDIVQLISSTKKIVDDPEIIKFIKMANKKGAGLEYTFDSKELLKDIYRSVC